MPSSLHNGPCKVNSRCFRGLGYLTRTVLTSYCWQLALRKDFSTTQEPLLMISKSFTSIALLIVAQHSVQGEFSLFWRFWLPYASCSSSVVWTTCLAQAPFYYLRTFFNDIWKLYVNTCLPHCTTVCARWTLTIIAIFSFSKVLLLTIIVNMCYTISLS